MVEISPWLQRPFEARSVTVGLLAADSWMIETSPWPRAAAAKGLSERSSGGVTAGLVAPRNGCQRPFEAKVWRCAAGLLVADSQMVEIPPWLQGPSKHRSGSVSHLSVGSQSEGQLSCCDVRAVSHLSVVQDLRDVARDRSFKRVFLGVVVTQIRNDGLLHFRNAPSLESLWNIRVA